MSKFSIPDSPRARVAVEEALNRVLEAFRTGAIVPAMVRLALSRSAVPSDGWSWRNRLMLFMSGTTDGRTFDAWKRLGRTIAEGSRAVYIWEPLKGYREDAKSGKKVSFIRGFKASPRFRVEDTEGAPLPESEPVEPVVLPALHDVAERLGIKVQYQGAAGGDIRAWGWYSDGQKRVCLYTHDARVFYHELAHAAHSVVLKNRGRNLVGGQEARQEAVAELTAAVLSEMFGSSTSIGNSYDYIQHYAALSNTPLWDLCMEVVVDVEACIKEILK